MMLHVLAFQIGCGAFTAFLAAREGRSRLAWFLVGMALPALGVVLALLVHRAGRRRGSPAERPQAPPRAVRRARRCTGEYIADCQGCPHFSRPLFDDSYDGVRKGRCVLLHRELTDRPARRHSRVILEE